MPLFSERNQLGVREPITDESPDWLRVAFVNRVLAEYLHTDRSSNSFLDGSETLGSPIGIKWLIERLALHYRKSPPQGYNSDLTCMQILGQQIVSLEWFQFYDLVEIVYRELLRDDSNDSYTGGRLSGSFIKKTNALFVDGEVNWQLDSSGRLHRVLSVEARQIEASEFSTHPSDPSSAHLLKARRFLDQRPSDSANSIKESISALESLARTLAPSTNTLGDAVKIFKKQGRYQSGLLDVVNRLYGFASDEPGVRHGSAEQERVHRADAEFVYVTALAVMKYLREAGR